jgi:hypothetical protein
MSGAYFPLLPIETKAKTHALLCTIGFLILLPIGVLVARYVRTFTKRWWYAHGIIQFLISGPIIFAGWALGYQTANGLLTGPRFSDHHEKIGLALLILYLVQLFIGTFIHFVKMPSLFHGHRPPQNYFHAILGLAILALAAYQVHYGLTIEWAYATGNLHPVPRSAIHAWEALIIIFWVLYVLGLVLIPRQFRQEKGGQTLEQEVLSSNSPGVNP